MLAFPITIIRLSCPTTSAPMLLTSTGRFALRNKRLYHGVAMLRNYSFWKIKFLAKTGTNFRVNFNHQICLSCCYSTQANIKNIFDAGRLPSSIERHCQKWRKLLLAEINAIGKYRASWFPHKLKCVDVLEDANTISFFLDIGQIPPKQRHSTWAKQFRVNQPVELHPLVDGEGKIWAGPMLHGWVKWYNFDKKQIRIGVSRIRQEKPIMGEASKLKGVAFEIKQQEKSAGDEQSKLHALFEFLAKRHGEWSEMPGYNTLLHSFGLERRSTKANRPKDLLALQKSLNELGANLDQSQREALGALMDWNRPCVAVHGPAGSGKSLLLAHYLRILHTQGKRVLLVFPTLTDVYHLMGQFCEITPEDQRDFACIASLKPALLSKVIASPAIRRAIEARLKPTLDQSVDNSDKNESGEHVADSLELPDLGNNCCKNLEENPAQLQQQSDNGIAHQKWMEQVNKCQIVFGTLDSLNMFNQLGGQRFDLVVFDHADQFAEHECWHAVLPLASKVRHFGDVHQPTKPMNSSFGQKCQSEGTISLLARLDRQENANAINCHLNRQYRSNPIIHEWPNRVFYKERAAEPSQSVKDISLENSLLEVPRKIEKSFFLPTAPLITDPLVLVDLSKLEGEWHSLMLKPEQNPQNLWYNSGEALLAAAHLSQLIERTSLDTSQIAYTFSTRPFHKRRMEETMDALYPSSKQAQPHINITYGRLLAHSAEVIVHSMVIPSTNAFRDEFHLRRLAATMTRTRRQFVLFARREWLAKGSEQSRQLLDTFLTKGRVCGPNDVCPLERPEQFWQCVRAVNAHAEAKKLAKTSTR